MRVVSGEARVLGSDLVLDQRAVRRRIGLLGHASGLYDDLDVSDNVRFALRSSGVNPDRAPCALETLGLVGRLADTPVRSLSAGQRRRVALAVLLARDPDIWLLDEPHAGLDADHRDLLDGLVKGAASRGRTVVIASHESERAEPLAGHIATVAGGVVVEVAPGPAWQGTESAGVERIVA